MTVAIDKLRTVETRLANLAELLDALATASGSRRLQEGALHVAATFANDTFNAVHDLLEPNESEASHGTDR